METTMDKLKNLFTVGALSLCFSSIVHAGYFIEYPSTDTNLPQTFQGGPNTYNSSFDITDDFLITDLNVAVDFTDGFFSDISAKIISPAGTEVSLFTSEVDNHIDVIFDDEATAGTLPDDIFDVPDATFHPASTYNPLGMLSDFDGESLLGTWTLAITDNEDFFVSDPGDANTLHSWGLIVAVPEPSTMSLLYSAAIIAGFGAFARRRFVRET